MSEGNSYRQILRSSSIIGGASILNILITLVKTKVAAVLLGPAGVGLIGLYTNLITVASTVAALGLSAVGTRQIAEVEADGDPQKIAVVRRALFLGTMVLALLGSLIFWLLRNIFSIHILAMPTLVGEIGWLALPVALLVACISQNVLLQGLRRVVDIAWVSISSSVLATILGVGALLLRGRDGLFIYVLAVPLASFLMGHWFIRRVPKVQNTEAIRRQDITEQWMIMVKLGFTFMIAGLASTAGIFGVRSLVQRELGEAALGHFQAAWSISMQYVGLVLGAMGTDFYPRLTAVIKDRTAACTLVNEQAEVALLLAAPITLAMAGLAPWVIELLYSSQFHEAAGILRWQLLGDILRIAGWPLVFIQLAMGAGRAFMISEWGTALVFAGVTALLLPVLGISATGVSFLAMYVVYLLLVYALARYHIGFRWRRSVLLLLFAVSLSTAFIVLVLSKWPLLSMVVGGLASGTSGFFAVHRLHTKGALPNRISGIVSRILRERRS